MDRQTIIATLLSTKPAAHWDANKRCQYILTCRRLAAVLCDSDAEFNAFLQAVGIAYDEDGFLTLAKEK